MAKTLLFGKKASITVRGPGKYKTVKRNVYFQSGKGTYIRHKNKKRTVSYTKFNNSGYTL